MALNTKWRCGSERRNERYQWLWTPNRKWTMAWNAKRSKIWLWTPNENTTLNVKLRSNNGSERRYWWVMALNTERRCDDGSERQSRTATLNVKLGNDGGFERRNWMISSDSKRRTKLSNGPERQTKQNMALNAETNDMQWLWTPNWRWVMALNVKTKVGNGSERHAEMETWL